MWEGATLRARTTHFKEGYLRRNGVPSSDKTTIDWRLSRNDGFTIVRFTHAGWAEPVEFLSHCSTKWAVFLLSLKALVETGEGSPSPNDVAISDWH